MNLNYFFLFIFIAFASNIQAQIEDSTELDRDYLDSIYIEQIQTGAHPYKVLHAEPLYIDLIRDLGARKGEKEWNVGMGLTDNDNHGLKMNGRLLTGWDWK
jgi:hypothetical protein